MALPNKIYIGYVGERYARSVDLDISELMAMWPGLTPGLVHQRLGVDAEGYPRPTTLNGTVLTWTFTPVETETKGYGEAQIIFTSADGERVGMSAPISTECLRSVSAGTDVPDVIQPYVQQLVAMKTQVEDAVNLWQNMTADVEMLSPGQDASVTYADGHLHFALPVSRGGEGGTAEVTKDSITNALGVDVVQALDNVER